MNNNFETAPSADDGVTLLIAADGKKLGKRINADGSKRGYDKAYHFKCLSMPGASIQELLEGAASTQCGQQQHSAPN